MGLFSNKGSHGGPAPPPPPPLPTAPHPSEPLAMSSEFPWHGSKFSPQPSSFQSQKLSPQLSLQAALVLASRPNSFSVHVTLRSTQVPFVTFRVKSHQDTSNMYPKFRCSIRECTTRSTSPTMGHALPSGHWILTLPSKCRTKAKLHVSCFPFHGATA
jgi:hypothetical protein